MSAHVTIPAAGGGLRERKAAQVPDQTSTDSSSGGSAIHTPHDDDHDKSHKATSSSKTIGRTPDGTRTHPPRYLATLRRCAQRKC